nr:MAG: putative RNA-dependent RNA polymerase [Guangxi cysto-like virus 6]
MVMMKQSTKPETFKPGSKVCDALFFGKSAYRNRDKQYSEGPIETLRGHMSNDWDFLTFKDRLSRALTDQFPATVDALGRVSGNGVRSNFYGLRYVGGYPQIPATYPLVDNSFLREQKGLSNTFVKPWHRTVARALARLFFKDLEPVPLKLRKNSSSMMPFYEKDMTKKQELVRYALRMGEKAGNSILEGDYITPWTNWYIGGAYHTVYRRQSSDAMTIDKGVFKAKDRPVADLEFALSGGRSGTFAPSNRSLDGTDFRIPAGFARERNRTAMGGPLGLNANLMVIAQAVRSRIYTEYAYTYHHTTRSSQQEEMRKMGYVIAADVSNHDWYWWTDVVDLIAEELADLGYADWWIALYKLRMKLPNYVTDVGPGEGNILLGDWRSPNNSGGLPSGNSFTDLDGAYLMTLVYFLIQVEWTYPELINQLQTVENAERVLDQYLKGKLPITLKDKSDDALLGWPDAYLHPRVAKLHKAMQDGESISPYMIVSYEHGGAFLGSILLYPEKGNTDGLVLIGNVNSLVTNQFSPEYGVQSNIKDRSKAKRPYPGLAWKTLSLNYGGAPVYGDIMDVVEREYARVYGTSYRAFRDEWLRDDERRLMDDLYQRSLKVPELTSIDIEVLNDPGKAEWKYDEKDISSALFDLMFNGIPLAEVEPIFNSIVRP